MGAGDKLRVEGFQFEVRLFEVLELLLPGVAPNSGTMLPDDREAIGNLAGDFGLEPGLAGLIDRRKLQLRLVEQAACVAVQPACRQPQSLFELSGAYVLLHRHDRRLIRRIALE